MPRLQEIYFNGKNGNALQTFPSLSHSISVKAPVSGHH